MFVNIIIFSSIFRQEGEHRDDSKENKLKLEENYNFAACFSKSLLIF